MNRVFVNDPPSTSEPDAGLCGNFSESTGCGYDPVKGCEGANGPGLAMRDHEIFAITWSDVEGGNLWLQRQREMYSIATEADMDIDGGAVIDVADLKLSNGEAVSPLVWSPVLTSPMGKPMKDVGLRVVNRTDFYRCRAPKSV